MEAGPGPVAPGQHRPRTDRTRHLPQGSHRRGAAIDTTTASGKLVFGIFAALAEFKREVISERTLAGLASARACGRKGGRPF
ncbi:recombinase family protein [Arthrobacter sp. MDT3-24]